MESVDLYRLEKRFDFRARMSSMTEGSDPAEQWYLQAIALAKTNPVQAQQRFQAIIDALGDSQEATTVIPNNDRKAIIDLCKKQLDKLAAAASSVREKEETILDQQLSLAQSLSTSDPEQASRIAKGLIVLYADKPWASEKLSAAKQLLATLTAKTSSP